MTSASPGPNFKRCITDAEGTRQVRLHTALLGAVARCQILACLTAASVSWLQTRFITSLCSLGKPDHYHQSKGPAALHMEHDLQ